MFKITIVEIETINKKSRAWEKIAETGNQRDGGAVFDYVDSVEEVDRETTVLEQTVRTLDLPAVIKAVNQL